MLLRRSSVLSTDSPLSADVRPGTGWRVDPLPTTVEAPTDTPSPGPRETPRLTLSTTQVVGSAVAAAGSAIAASSLGVAGTIIGAVLGSLVMTIGSALVAHSLKFAGFRLRLVRVPTPDSHPVDGHWMDHREMDGHLATPKPHAVTTSPAHDHGPAGVYAGRRLAVGILAGAAIALAGITGYELVTGHSVSSGTQSGTTIGGVVAAPAPGRVAPARPASSPSTTAATTPVPTETVTVTAPPTTAPTTTSAPPTAPSSPTTAPPSPPPTTAGP